MNIDDISTKVESKDLDKYLDTELKSLLEQNTYDTLLNAFEKYTVARNWFYSINHAIGDKRPYDLCKEGKEKEVYNFLIRIDWNMSV